MEITFSLYFNFLFLYIVHFIENTLVVHCYLFVLQYDHRSWEVAVITQEREIDVGSCLSTGVRTWSLSKSLWGSGLALFILAGSLSLGEGTGWGESGFQMEERAVAFGGVGTLLMANSRAMGREPDDCVPHTPPLLHLISKQCCPLA